MKRARNHERKKNRDVKFIENSDMKKLDKLMGSLESENKSKSKLTVLAQLNLFSSKKNTSQAESSCTKWWRIAKLFEQYESSEVDSRFVETKW